MSGRRLHEGLESPMVSVRLVTADSYQAKPLPQLDPSFSEFRASEIKHVPVIRVFGATTNGEKTCLHVHGVFPYLFVPYTGEEDPRILAYRLAASLDAAINVSLGSATSNSQHVYCVQRVSGTPFYGYHRKEHQFFKVYFYNPAMIKRAADLLQNGSVLNQSLQPHEAHINYILQFMMDYNIYGMSFVNLREVKHRRVTQTLGALTSSGQSVSSENSEMIYLPMEIERQSTCELEIDAHASDILNRLEIDKNIKLSPGLTAIWDEERARRAQAGFQGGDSQLVNPKSPSRPPFHPTDNDVYQGQRLARRLLMISQGDESTLSTASNRSVAYAAEVREGENLLNASRVPNVSVERIHRDPVEDSLDVSSITDASVMPESQNLTQDNSILEADDMPLVDLLAQLARENDEDLGTVDADSLLGSQASVLQDENDKIEQEDEDEEEDVVDLNLTSLELESLSLVDRASGKQELARVSATEKSDANSLVVSPFLSPWESPSCSPKSPNGVGEDSEDRMPQYDGAGDVSPSIFGSDDEDTDETSNNTKELDGFTEFNSAREVKEPPKNSQQNRSSRQTPCTNLTLEGSGRAEFMQDSATDRQVPPEETSLKIADIPVAHYCVVGYEPFDGMLEMANDLMPDFADMESSMEIGGLLPSEDSEKVELVGEISSDEEIVLETVLNGDPCFTESAELDKSDVTELHDQYVSLLDNALLPDLPGIDNDLDDASSSTEAQFGSIDGANEVFSNSCDDRDAINTPDGYSSSENVAPNVQELAFRGFPSSKSNDASDNREPSNCKEQSRLGGDTADFNCNVVATWAELQNIQIVDKSENVRPKRKFRRFRAGPRAIKRRGDSRLHPVVVTSQAPRENAEIITLNAFTELPSSSPEYPQRFQSQDPENVLSFTCGVKTNTKEQLFCTSQNFAESSLTRFSNEETNQGLVRSTKDIDAANRQASGTSASHLQNSDISLNVDSPMSYGTCFYSAKRSESLPEFVNRRHRHCVISRANKIVRGHVFTTDELWIIHRKRRRRSSQNRAKYPSAKAVCTSKKCKFPIVFLEKIEQIRIKDEKVPESEEIAAGENSAIAPGKVSLEDFSPGDSDKKEKIRENPSPSMTIKTREKIVEIPKESPEKTRRKRKVLPAPTKSNDSEKPRNIDLSMNASDSKSQNPACGDSSSNDLLHADKGHQLAGRKRGTYNTKRRPNAQNFVKQRRNGKKMIANEDKVKGKETKEPKLPGIPGIPLAISRKPRRSRNNVPVNCSDAGDDGKLTKTGETSKVLRKNRATGGTSKESVNNASKNTRSIGLVPPQRDVEISTKEVSHSSILTESPISLIPKKKTIRHCERKNSSLEGFSTAPKKLAEPEKEPKKKSKCPVVRDEKKSSELTALSAMLKQAKSRSMRMQIKKLIRKRINERRVRDYVEKEFRIKTYPRKENEVRDKKAEESTPKSLINNEPPGRSTKVSETVVADKIEKFEISDAASFETVTDASADEMSKRNDIAISRLKNANDFGDTTLVIEYSDPSTEIFDNEASVDSVIVETHDVPQFPNDTEESTAYDTGRYENAISEANFFAGKDYSIDAVSVEIPTCLFEEDSIPIDKLSSKRPNHDSVQNSIDFSSTLDAESVSELSVDPRDLDVYDVQSLTSSSSFSNLNETSDISESLQVMLHDRRTKVFDTGTSYLVIREESLGAEIIDPDSNIAEESPTFEALSPEPHIDLTFGLSIENEFTVQSEIRYCENQSVSKDSEKNIGKGNARMTVEKSKKRLESSLPEYSFTTTLVSPTTLSSETPESSEKNISRETSQKNIFTAILENSRAKSTPKIALTAPETPNGIRLDEIEETSETTNRAENHFDAQIVINSRIEPEILGTNENEVSVHAGETINHLETNRKNEQFSKNTKKTEKSSSKFSFVVAHEPENWTLIKDKDLLSNSNECESRSSVQEQEIRLEHEKVNIGCAKIDDECEKLSKDSGDKKKHSILLKRGENVTEIAENVQQLSNSCENRQKLSERLDWEIPPSGILFINKFSQGSRNHPEKAPMFGKTFGKRSKVVSSSFEMRAASENRGDERENMLEKRKNFQTETINETPENTKSNFVDINKNDVEIIPKAKERGLRIPPKQTDCRSISIERNPKISQEPKSSEIQDSSQGNRETDDETLEKLTDKPNRGIENISRKRVRNYRRIMSKNTKVPKRRSVRICAEMASKSSRRANCSTSTLEGTTVELQIANTAAIASESEGEGGENKKKIIVSSTRLEARSFVEASKPDVSQELVLAEQSFMDENSAPIIPKQRGRRRKARQSDSQEISLPIIADENTAPIFGNSTRQNLQMNVKETEDDLKCTKPIVKKVVENKAAEITSQPVNLKVNIPESPTDSENVISSKRSRAVRSRLRSMSKRTKVYISRKSAPKKNNKEKTKRPENSMSTTKNMHQGRTPSLIFPPSTVSLNSTSQNIFLTEKNDESLMITPKVEKDSVQPIKNEFTTYDDIKKQFGINVNIITKIPILPEHELQPPSESGDESKLNDLPVTKNGRRKKETKKISPKLSNKNENSTKSMKSVPPATKRGRSRKCPVEIAKKPFASENSKNFLKSGRSKETGLRVGKKHQKLEEFSRSRFSEDKLSVYRMPENSQSGISIAQPHRSIESPDTTLHKIQQSSTSKIRRGQKSNDKHALSITSESSASESQEESEYLEESSEDSSSEDQEFYWNAKKHYKKSIIKRSSKTKKLSKIRKDLHATKKVTKPKEEVEDSKASVLNRQSQILPNSHKQVRQPKPIIRLKRLSRTSLERYGIVYSCKEKRFVKTSFKTDGKRKRAMREIEEEFQVPAYDGAADLSSSDEEDQDVTIAREEKRVCTYSSSKKSVSKGETVSKTPLKRKLEMESGALSPKRQTLRTNLRNETKAGSLNSPVRTSTLKTPGRIAAKYSPLKIIVTSPKVRKEIPEPSLPRSGKSDDEARTSTAESTATTPSRKSLHDNLLRGRINSVKSTPCKLGDERASADKAESKAVDGSGDSGTMLKDGRDVRKKLLFLDQDSSSSRIDESLTKMVQKGRIKLRESFNDNKRSEEITEKSVEIDVSESLEDSMALDGAAGPSRCPENSGNSWICDIEKEAESDEDENEEDVCNVTFTQFIESQRNERDATFLANLETETEESNKIIKIMPKFKPPSRERVLETMEEYGIPKFRNQEPFFSESTDVPKQKEVAHKILKVSGKGVEFLAQFVSSLEEVTGIGRWRKMWLNEFHPPLARTKEPAVKMALASAEKVLVTPIALPPTQKQVKDWVRARDYLNRKKVVSENPKIQVKGRAVTEVQNKVDDDQNFVSSPFSSDSSVIEASPERTLVSEDLTKSGDTTLKSKLAKRGLLRRSIMNRDTGFQELNDWKDKSLRNSPDTQPDPSLLDVLQKSRLFRDQEASRHLGVSCGQIEFLSDSSRSNIANENLQRAKALIKYQYLTIMCLEIHVVTRGDLLPDAQHDPIAAIFYSVQSDVPPESSIKPLEHGVIVVADSEKAARKMYYSYASSVPWKISFANNEEALFNALVTLITRTDPEILMGWEIETLSWGYVFQRASSLGINLLKRVSRIPATQYKWEYEAPDIEKLAEVKLPGRIVLDIWRIMRRETALLSYTFESVIHHVLNERIPCPSFKVLTDWWDLEKARPSRCRVVEHYSIRVLGILRILDQLDIIGRTSELARLFGIQFFEVFSRGSQFRVESVMLRLAKPLNYIAVSPSSQQRASMRAMEALPLILEPESMLYSDPLIVLDFQSLYPSIIIAHNLCFSTCLGRIEHIGQSQPFEFGAYTLRVPKKTAVKLQNKVNFAPCGVAYVKPEVRLGILPRMLTEILETRFMVKKAMKDHDKNDKTLQRALHSRQMGLKFLANVTYGYTAANFSGRMPCIEVGDSVISKSKETLERAIKLVKATPKWGARVVYGDTDSLFILVPGKSKDEAFVIGNEIADAVTASNLPPIKLKFEKVLYPAILQTKKRYCGYMYETPDQETPTYLAKGIETVRRDGCPAVSKILEKTLKILFEAKDVSLVKKYVTRQLDKVLRGKVSIQDLTFAKEFRGLKGYKAKACVPSLELTRRLMRKDPRAVPRTSERVRYVIVAGAPNQALIHCVRTPWELMADPGLRPNAIYYVTRVIIPPLNRCLNLMGVDVNEWYKEMPHRQILDNPVGQPSDKQKLTIFQYFGTIVCVACGQPSNKGICTKCLKRPADTLVVIYEKLRWLDRTNNHVTSICQSCVGRGDVADCGSLDCPILYRRARAERELSQAIQLREIIKCGNNLEF